MQDRRLAGNDPHPAGSTSRPEALFFTGEAPVLPVLAWYLPVPGIRSTILRWVLMMPVFFRGFPGNLTWFWL